MCDYAGCGFPAPYIVKCFQHEEPRPFCAAHMLFMVQLNADMITEVSQPLGDTK